MFQLSELLDLVSPKFLEVVPVSQSGPFLKNLIQSPFRGHKNPAFEKVQTVLDSHGVAVEISFVQKKEAGTIAISSLPLFIYFAQIFFCPETILDVRFRSFSAGKEKVLWSPLNLTHRWDPKFITSLQKMYSGFYRNEPAVFRNGLDQLGLLSAEEIFLKHLGEGDQTEVEFSPAHFRSSFHAIFVHCQKEKITLPVDFLPLGILLGTLYENLSHSGKVQNVRAAFDQIVGAG